MPALIVIRLLPEKPLPAGEFSSHLDGLTIEAFDASYVDPAAGSPSERLGSASYLPPEPPTGPIPIPDPGTQITQHFERSLIPPRLEPIWFSVATAVIEVPDASFNPEHSSLDVRLNITRNGSSIELNRTFYNVETAPFSLPSNPNEYPLISNGGAPVVSLHVFLPPPGQASGGVGILPENGAPPNFDALHAEISAVLGADPGDAGVLGSLSPEQSLHIAREIVSPSSLPRPQLSLDAIYTGPNSINGSEERARMTFESDLAILQTKADGQAERLAGFVFAMSVAVQLEQASESAGEAGLAFPVDLADGEKAARVKLAGINGVAPFRVPAAYWYALTAVMPIKVSGAQRYSMVLAGSETQNLVALNEAHHDGIIEDVPGVNRNQAARRIEGLALAAEPNLTTHVLSSGTEAATLVTNWLASPVADISQFWTSLPPADRSAHLRLVLAAITQEHVELIDALNARGVSTVGDLENMTGEAWREQFSSQPTSLPEFTKPGSIKERSEVFLRHLRRFFQPVPAPAAAVDATASTIPQLHRSPGNLVDQLNARVAGLDLETFEANSAFAALDSMFAGNHVGRSQFVDWLECLKKVLSLADGVGPDKSPIRFSVVEALWARGFTDPSKFGGLSQSEFKSALAGTVAYDYAAQIYSNAEAQGASVPEAIGDFAPVNPHGALVNCLPPQHRSPLGPVAYLADLLLVDANYSCEEPLSANSEGSAYSRLGDRRGPLDELLASYANCSVRLPMIDIVNEVLQSMVENGSPAVMQTGREKLGGHTLSTSTAAAGETRVHDAEKMFEILPEHSTPATPTASQGAWEHLAADFSSCGLPYNQPLDVLRTYLQGLGTTQYKTMRAYRRDITEFVLAPGAEPSEFQRHLWRYPVRLPVALAYLCIPSREYEVLYQPGQLGSRTLPSHFGFNLRGRRDPEGWVREVLQLPEFMNRTCLSYCEVLALRDSGYVEFELFDRRERAVGPCEPCCIEEIRLQFSNPREATAALKRLYVFIRLWRSLQKVEGADYSFAQLADIVEVLGLFEATAVNPDFVRQLAAFQMLRDDFELDLVDTRNVQVQAGSTGVERTHLLGLWRPDSSRFTWALEHLLDQIQRYAICTYGCPCRPPEFLKLLADNLGPLSQLAGFGPVDSDSSWLAKPTHTLRMAEILAKIYASKFGVGEILWIFTAGPQLRGDDPLPGQTENEAHQLPFALPDDQAENSLFALREALLRVEVDDASAQTWSWSQMTRALQQEFGLPMAPDDDRWDRFCRHFFPSVVEAAGYPVAREDRVYQTALPSTAPDMWNTPDGPLDYRAADGMLEVSLPITDLSILEKLSRVRQLADHERFAVKKLYAAPREELAFFSFLFEDLRAAERALIEEPDEKIRWAWFQRAFALFHARCHQIAKHAAQHVQSITGTSLAQGKQAAMLLLKELWADENAAVSDWENDNGEVPDPTWSPSPNGGAFHALLGVVGTGMVAEYRSSPDGALRWRQMHGDLEAFGAAENARNAPLPTLLPQMDTSLTPELLEYAAVRNGFALGNDDGCALGGAEPFTVTWRGLLLVEQGGEYAFRAGAPSPEGEHPDFEEVRRSHRWRVTLQQGQASWVLLAHDWPAEEAPASCTTPLVLERGFYDFVVEFERLPLEIDGPEDLCPQTTGFQLKYSGPDAGEGWITIPRNKLFIPTGTKLEEGIESWVPGTLASPKALSERHAVSVRSMRRTMMRLTKAMLFAAKFGLSVRSKADSGASELGFMLAHPEKFAGQSYYDSGSGYVPHRAWFDFNFLPVLDNYHTPDPSTDQRCAPSRRRSAALFDWWERTFDYVEMRAATERSPERPVWLLFHEAAESHEDLPAQLLRHMGVGIRHSEIVRHFFEASAGDLAFEVESEELRDERWAIRVWRAELWLRALEQQFMAMDIRDARPHLWASEGPELSGLENLTTFYRNGCIENGEPLRYREIKELNDGLRERGRQALLAYLTHLDRVQLPEGGFATKASELSELLLIDVEVGLCQKATRIQEAISATQLFVRRARLGLEPSFSPGPSFASAYDRRLATFQTWQACKRRDTYRESWISWGADAVSSGSEAYDYLRSELRRSDLTQPRPGALVPNLGNAVDVPKSLRLLQEREPAFMDTLHPDRDGIGLQGMPERHARTSWLASLGERSRRQVGSNHDDAGNVLPARPQQAAGEEHFPMWFPAAVRLGRKFVRVAAAGAPMAATTGQPGCSASVRHECCSPCGTTIDTPLDEYYFWLDVSEEFRAEQAQQNAELVSSAHLANAQAGVAIPETGWHDPDELPRLLHWTPRTIARLNWCRIRNGEFEQPRRAAHGIELSSHEPGTAPELEFSGRAGDSLWFSVPQAVSSEQSPEAGFRYDLAVDDAQPLPEIVPAPEPAPIAGLPAFPFFAWHTPGAPVAPVDRFGAVLAVANHLATQCRYEDALKWLELRWAPLSGDNIWAACDRDEEDPQDPEEWVETDGPPVRRPVWRERECCCPSEPVSSEIATRRHILMRYVEILLDWADAQMRRNTPEAFAQARLLADTAKRLLGPTPKTVVVEADEERPSTILRARYIFDCAPLNPQLMCLYTRTDDRLAEIRSCSNASRLASGKIGLDMPFLGDSELRACWKVEASACADSWCAVSSPYRFSVLIERALRAAGECRAMGSQLLSAYEKGDGEYLAQLRVMHERQVGELTLSVRKDHWRDADWQVQALRKTKAMAITRLNYYQGLIDAGLLAGEAQYEPLTDTATGLRSTGNILAAIGQAMNMVPDPNVGFPTNFVTLPPGKKLAMVFSSMGTVVNTAADIVSTAASLGLTKDGWERREDEWQHQVNVITIEIEQIERQILGAERRRDAALQELNTHRQSMANTAEVHDFLRDKFTNHTLYLWLQKETAALHAGCYALALQCAQQAEQAFNFERGLSAERYIKPDAWDSLHEGLLSGERLSLSLSRMQKAYEDRDRREYELTKHISLRQHFPDAFMRLMVLGACEIELPEWLFDLDCPGHYMRRIKSLAFSLPCVAGPYVGVRCRVSVLSSKVRTSPHLLEPEHRCCDVRGCNNGYPALPEDPRIVALYSATEAVTTSEGQQDTGLFQLDLRDPRYLPFEYQGAVCRMRIELPHANNHFDMDSLSDLVVHMRYTAREGGERLRQAASECARNYVPGAGLKFLDARRDLLDHWRERPAPRRCASRQADAKAQFLGLTLRRRAFPYLSADRKPRVTRFRLLFEAPDAEPSRHHEVLFYAGQSLSTLEPDTCKEGVFTVKCVGDAQWPGFFHGVLDLEPLVLSGDSPVDLGVLCFGPMVKRVCQAWLLFDYDAVQGDGVCPDLAEPACPRPCDEKGV